MNKTHFVRSFLVESKHFKTMCGLIRHTDSTVKRVNNRDEATCKKCNPKSK